MSDDLLASALSAVTSTIIVSYDTFKTTTMLLQNHSEYKPLNPQALHETQLVCGPVGERPDKPSLKKVKIYGHKDDMTIFIRTLTGTHLQIGCTESNTIQDVKVKIHNLEGIPPPQQRLLFSGKQLEDEITLDEYNIGRDDLLHLVLRLKGGSAPVSVTYIPNDLLDMKYDFDFSKITDKKVKFIRGPFPYVRPCGWTRFAIKVLDRYEDNVWLGVTARKSNNEAVENEWPVSYHGTALHNAKSIAEVGFLQSKGKRFAYGHGIYSSPSIRVAELYASEFTHAEIRYKVVIQNRVNPKTVKIIPASQTGRDSEYWINEKQEDIRPYGICIKKV